MTKNFAANLKIGAVMGSSVGKVFGGVNRKMKEQEAELKRLRSAYKDAAKGTGEYAGKLDQLQREIDKTEAKLKRLRAASRIDLGKSIKGIGSKMWGDTKRLGLAGGVIGGAGLAIGKNMLDTTAAFEKQLALLKTLEGSEEKANKAFGWIQDFAQKTPYELSQVTEAFARLKAFGIDPIRGDSLRVLGDAASGMSKDIMQLVDAIADAQMGQNERLMELGIRGEKEKDKITYFWEGKDGKSLSKTVDARNKALIRSTLLAIWNSKYKGAMAEQSKTWNGMVSNLKDSWARFAYMVMQSGPFESLKVELGNLLKQVEVWANDGTMKKWADETGKFMMKAGSEVKKFGIQLFTALDYVQNLLGGWDKLVWAIVAVNFAPTILALGSMAKALFLVGKAAWASLGPWGILIGLVVGLVAIFKNLDAVGARVNQFFDDLYWGLAPLGSPRFTDMIGNGLFEIQLAIEDLWDKLKNGATLVYESIKLVFVNIGQAMIEGMRVGFDWITSKLNGMISGFDRFGQSVKSFFGFGGETSSGSAAPITPSSSMPPRVSGATQNNNWNINVNAPGGDGRRIADSIRSEFNRKPLYDMDSFAPAR